MKYEHDFIEREIAVTADGYCPLCLAAECERLRAENAQFRGCLEYIARPVIERSGVVDSAEALVRAAAARDVLNQHADHQQRAQREEDR